MAKSIQLRLKDDAFHKAVRAKGAAQTDTWEDFFRKWVDIALALWEEPRLCAPTGNLYVLNSAVITTEGLHIYRHINVETARAWLLRGGWRSYIRYDETARAMEELFGVSVPVNAEVVQMQPGDEALVFRLVFPKGYRPDPSRKGSLGIDFIKKHCEIGILRKLQD